MLRITRSGNVPAGSYLSARDVEPMLGEELIIFSGSGPSYLWGNAVVASTLMLHDRDLVAIHMRICHRYGTEQAWRYYQRKAECWQRIMWNSLLRADRLRVFEAYRQQAPAFAAIPGSLPGKSWADAPKMRIGPTYLLARVHGERYYVLNKDVEYILGTPLSTDRTEPAQMHSYPCLTCLMIKWRAGTLSRRNDLPPALALLECRVEGDVHLSGGKVISSTLCPERLVEVLTQ